MGGLSFLSPLFLLGVLCIAVPIVLHLLRREEAPRVRFSAVKFLRRAPIEQTRRKKLREWLLLALRCAALVLLAIAFARPYFVDGAAAASSSVTVVAVDTSFSMGAPGRFDRARALAAQAIDQAPRGALVAVIGFDDGATVVSEPASERAVARAALTRLAPTYGGTRYGSALTQASTLIGSRQGQIIVVTDLQRGGWEQNKQGAIPPRITVEVRDVGPAVPNLGVKAIRAEGNEAVVTVANSAATAVASRVRVSIESRVAADLPFTAEALVSTDVRVPVVLPGTGAVSASIVDRTGFPADDTRYLTLDPPPPLPVTIVAGVDSDPFYVERAMGLAEGGKPRFQVTSLTGAKLAEMTADARAKQAVIVLLTTRGLDRRGREAIAQSVSQGGGLLVAAGSDVEASVIETLFEPSVGVALEDAASNTGDARLVPADPRHPLFRSLGAFAPQLGRARFRQVSTVEETEGGKVLARFSGGSAALVEYQMGRGRMIIFASDLSNKGNDLPLQPTFVPLIHETVHYLGSRNAPPADYLIADAPRGLPREPGVRTLTETGRRAAINVDARESDFAKMTADEFTSAISRMTEAGASEARSGAQEAEGQQNYWRYGLSLMLLALVTEGVLGRRMG